MNDLTSRIINGFHALSYYGLPGEGPIFPRTYWMNVPCAKCPLDMWIVQEILAETKPDLVIETGTYFGGSALFMAHMMDMLGHGQVLTVDIYERPRPRHPRIHYVNGSSADAQLLHDSINTIPHTTRMVVLDSDHRKEHVLQELKILAPYVTPGNYLIVEDTNINGHPVLPQFGPGPAEAVAEFLEGQSDFVVDRSREKFLLTFHPGGYLKRVK